MSQPGLLVLCGPTASGKTRLGVELALRLNGEVISADSMQLYRGMSIGTAKPTQQEQKGVPHHMLDVADPTESYSVARYAAEAAACVEDVRRRGKLPIVVGGTGLYIDALVSGRPFAAFSGQVRAELEERAAREGADALHRELERIDPERAAKLPPGDRKRILRALEVWYETGKTISRHDAETRALPPRYRAAYFGLAYQRRADLWSAADRRVDEMMAAGLVGEVESLLRAGVDLGSTSMQAIGYKELARALESGASPAQAAEEIKLRTRQYAKRQLTWFRRLPEVRWHLWGPVPDFSYALQEATDYVPSFLLG